MDGCDDLIRTFQLDQTLTRGHSTGKVTIGRSQFEKRPVGDNRITSPRSRPFKGSQSPPWIDGGRCLRTRKLRGDRIETASFTARDLSQSGVALSRLGIVPLSRGNRRERQMGLHIIGVTVEQLLGKLLTSTCRSESATPI